MSEDDFYEDDEPIEDIKARLEGPYEFVTAPPRGVTYNFYPTRGSERWTAQALHAQNEGACR